jgi:tetratricopeptide (TPR) repeat protein
VVLKALEKEPARRYASAEALLTDLRRHRAGLPVVARPASTAYRVRAFVRRHRAGVTAGAASVVVLVAAVVALALAQQRTARERDRANREATQADLARDFALGLFSLADPDETHGDTLTTEQLLDQGAVRALEGLAGEPEVQEEVLLALAGINQRLNRFEEAEAQYAHVQAQRTARHGADHPGVAEALAGLGTLAFERGALSRADAFLGRAVAIQQRHHDAAGLARSLYTYGALARNQSDYAAAEARHRESLALRRTHFGSESDEVAASLMSLAHLHHTTGAYDEAEARYREALALQVSLSGEYHTQVASICNALASLLRTRGDFAASDSLYRRALAVQQRLTPGDRLDVALVLGQWAHLLRDRGQPEAAEARAREALAMIHRIGEDESDVGALVLTALGRALTEQGRYAEAIPVHERVMALYEANVGPDHWQTGLGAYDLAAAHLGRGDVVTAGALYRRADALFAPEPDSIGRETALLGLGRVALAEGRPAAAESPLRRSLAIREAALGAEHPQTAEAQSWLGVCLVAQGRFAEAGPLLLASARVLNREARRSIHEAVRANLAAHRAAR